MNLKARKLEELFTGPRTWCKNRLVKKRDGEPTGNVWDAPLSEPGILSLCLVGGAMQVCRGGKHKAMPMIKELAARIKRLFPERANKHFPDWTIVVEFNNDHETKFKDIKKIIKGL